MNNQNVDDLASFPAGTSPQFSPEQIQRKIDEIMDGELRDTFPASDTPGWDQIRRRAIEELTQERNPRP